jgi:hypothetical protein
LLSLLPERIRALSTRGTPKRQRSAANGTQSQQTKISSIRFWLRIAPSLLQPSRRIRLCNTLPRARFFSIPAAATKLQHCPDCLFNASLKLSPSAARSIMSSTSFWSNACKQAKGKPLQTLLDALHGSCGATVRRARAAGCALLAAV